MKCDVVEKYDKLLGEIIATLRVNLNRGSLRTDDDEQFEKMLNRWFEKLTALR